MLRSPLIYATAVLLSTALLFSCAETEPPPFPPEEGEEQEQSSSSSESGSNYESSSSQTISSSSAQVNTPSSQSTAQSSSSSIAGSSSSSSTQGGQSSSSKAATVTGACVENNPISGFTCAWDGYKSGSILIPGKVLKPSGTIPSGCTVAWQYKDDVSPLADCLQTNENGLISEGSKNYVLFAKLTCDDGVHINACNPTDGWSYKKAPELVGTCTWSKNPTTSARGATPSGVTVVDTDNVCSSPTVVYKYADGTWPSTGILTAWQSWDKTHTETYTDIEATVNNCPALANATVRCPPLEVGAGADYQITCSDGVNPSYCEGKTNSVKLQNDECVDVEIKWTTVGYNPNIHMICEGNFDYAQQGEGGCTSYGGCAPNSQIDIIIGTYVVKGTTGTSYVTNQVNIISNIQVGTSEVSGICVSFSGYQKPNSSGVTCKLMVN